MVLQLLKSRLLPVKAPARSGMPILQFPKLLSSYPVVAQMRWLTDTQVRETPGSPFLQPPSCCGTVKFKDLCTYQYIPI